MKVYRSLDEIGHLMDTIVTSGTFDGVHLGHIKILERLVALAKLEKKETVVITFWPHPRFVLSKEKEPIGLLSSLEEKLLVFQSLGIDHILVIPFTLEFSKLTSNEFVTNILVNILGVEKLVIGYDHKFGQNREGSFEYLQAHAHEYGFEVEEIPQQDIDDVGISSTRIRKALEVGDVALAARYLGRDYALKGTVIQGKQLGRTIGFPTANIQVDEPHKLIPLDGVYAVRVKIDNQRVDGMMNIGFRPTVNGLSRTIEVNLFDFDRDVYDKEVKVYFVDRIRDEKKFKGLDELTQQLTLDKIASLRLLKEKGD
jgi:riboflavin kinase/FMN adenylyltransferase